MVPAGTGKTTSILALAHELLGPNFKEAVLDLNASDDRIEHLMAIYLIVVNNTSGAQQALRRTMEIHSNTIRFALACNTSSKVIEPIQSRRAPVRFSRSVLYVSEGLESIIFTADGDMRQELNNLLATYSGLHFVNKENVRKIPLAFGNWFCTYENLYGVGSYLHQVCGLLAKFSQFGETGKAAVGGWKH
ncbi:hypothetical protein DITRI_Ditri04bG0121900 [Diplodiscus trichospermus]